MRKLLLLGLLLCIAFVSQAAVLNSVINKTTCPITITQMCYDPTSTACNKFPNWTITVPPMSSAPMPRPACPLPFETAYHVCWGVPACAGICVDVAGQVPPPALVCIGFLPLSTPLPPCPQCKPMNVTVTYDPINNNVIIQ